MSSNTISLQPQIMSLFAVYKRLFLALLLHQLIFLPIISILCGNIAIFDLFWYLLILDILLCFVVIYEMIFETIGSSKFILKCFKLVDCTFSDISFVSFNLSKILVFNPICSYIFCKLSSIHVFDSSQPPHIHQPVKVNLNVWPIVFFCIVLMSNQYQPFNSKFTSLNHIIPYRGSLMHHIITFVKASFFKSFKVACILQVLQISISILLSFPYHSYFVSSFLLIFSYQMLQHLIKLIVYHPLDFTKLVAGKDLSFSVLNLIHSDESYSFSSLFGKEIISRVTNASSNQPMWFRLQTIQLEYLESLIDNINVNSSNCKHLLYTLGPPIIATRFSSVISMKALLYKLVLADCNRLCRYSSQRRNQMFQLDNWAPLFSQFIATINGLTLQVSSNMNTNDTLFSLLLYSYNSIQLT